MIEKIEPNVWVGVGNSFVALIKPHPNGTWEVWVASEGGTGFRSAWNLASEEEAARNVSKVVARTYGDGRIVVPAPQDRGASQEDGQA